MNARELSDFLACGLRERVVLRLHENLRTPAMRKTFDGGYSLVRLHRAFLSAPDVVLARLIDHLRDPEQGREVELRRYCEGGEIPKKRSPTGASTGHRSRYHDLEKTFRRINDTYFHGRVRCRIQWGREGKASRKSSIQFGSYCYEDELIRIHPALDDPLVPQRFLDYVVYHEMLHAVFRGGHDAGGRKRFHDETFHRFEKRFKHYDWARRWERENLDRFLA